MGARQSKRSVDISNPPKKGEVEGGVEAEGGKLERLEEGDVATVKATLNGTAPHAEKEATSPVTEVSEVKSVVVWRRRRVEETAVRSFVHRGYENMFRDVKECVFIMSCHEDWLGQHYFGK